MVAFYRDVLGLTITKQNWRLGVVFLSADPYSVDHEIALIKGRPGRRSPPDQPDLAAGELAGRPARFPRPDQDSDCIESLVCHASAIGCYFRDPEGNRTEVFWVTGRPCWVPTANPIDIHRPDEVVLAEVDRLWEQLRHVPVGGRMADEPATLEVGGPSEAGAGTGR